MQGRFKRDSAAAEQEPRAGTDRAQNPGQGPAGEGGDGATRNGTANAASESTAPAAKKPKAENAVGPRIALRNWRISTRLVALLTLPVVAATSLGGIRISESLQDMEQLDHMQLLTKLTEEATDLAKALQAERDLSAGPLANGKSANDYQVANPRKTTDRAQKAFMDATAEIPATEGDEALQSIRQNVSQIAAQVVQIGGIRQEAYKAGVARSVTVEAYSRLIRSLLSLSQDMAQATSNPEMIKRTRALAAFSSAKEYASVQQAIIASALPTSDSRAGKLEAGDRLYGYAAQQGEKVQLKQFQTIYESAGGDSDELTSTLTTGNPSIDAADKYSDRVLSNDSGMAGRAPRGHLNFTDEYGTKIQAMTRIEAYLLDQMETKARELRSESQREAIINGALILLVLGVSLVGAFVVARSMIRSLRRLQDTATKVAQDRLPELVKQLSESDPQDVDTSVESVGVHSRDEIGQVAAAFDDVHREAVRLAAEQALLRGNVNAMFTNLSRRSQGLIQRQLSLISELESREADPDQLSSLFKLDHLATRMRRNGENLLVLAGEEPGRRWTRPVPLVDVLRAAASEVEQYERIELAAVPATEVAGRVVNDLVHLLAELLENATSFSSPQTKVRVTGHALPDGRVLVEIHDTGIGLSPEDLAAINERLASPPTVDVSVSRRMGLFVVGRLSLRHGIRIQLRPSDSGGTTALVMLPVDVAQGGKKPAPKSGPGGQGAMPQGPSAPGGRLTGGPGAAGGAGNGGRPGLGGAPTGAAGRLAAGAGAARGQVGAGSGPRAALPGREGVPRQNGPQDRAQGQAQQPQPQSAQTEQMPQVSAEPQRPGLGAGGFGGAQSAIPSRTDVWGGQKNQGQQGQGQQGQGQQGQGQQQGQNQGQQQGGYPRAELPGGNPQQQRPQSTSWGNDQAQPVRRPQQEMSPLDAPRGHEEPESTGQFARPAAPQGPGSTGQFPRPDLGHQQAPQAYQPGAQDPASTAQFPRPDFGQPQQAPQGYQQQAPQAPAPAPAPRQRGGGDYGAPRPAGNLPQQPQQPQLQQPRQPEALPPAGSSAGARTPLYDTLETNWFNQSQGQSGQGGQSGHGQDGHGHQAPQAHAPQSAPQQPAPQRRPAPQQQGGGQQAGQQPGGPASWRTSPNDELVRQAERVRKPAAGGITTSGLPKRVPRANLVPGTAQEQAHTAGPQVSRAPDDVRGRLTNLRRGIQQGRQAGNSTTGSFPTGPTHQQEH
ncbi:nitrate- and nitrite sensing domain-containing protein [Streptomyces sp. P9(2023)]|uniref:sensor histidine kinase n=1 Tax=Streptomyces sp. P9(2023) TaxID=3064394 RepID=UPI0028F3F809|nr:nitrate- and nitrite sensing domain-containing protein [Streptomyces sp. P9(2023)]MDT9692711.1 nitrate- and nitrite sensing domain-containing protein [Streptomyces sp. P9(2023)]